jgi:hypothetical protein
MQGMTIADAIRSEGKAEGKVEGRAEGKAEGKTEGKAEGKTEGKAEAVLRLGRKNWGEPDTATRQTIQAIHDEALLDRMVDALLEAQSWADLLNVK